MLTKQRYKFFKSKASKDLGYNILISFQINYSLCFHSIYIRWASGSIMMFIHLMLNLMLTNDIDKNIKRRF